MWQDLLPASILQTDILLNAYNHTLILLSHNTCIHLQESGLYRVFLSSISFLLHASLTKLFHTQDHLPGYLYSTDLFPNHKALPPVFPGKT